MSSQNFSNVLRFETVAEVPWSAVCAALSPFSATREAEIDGVILPVATHSFGERDYVLTADAEPDWLGDIDEDGFHLLAEDDTEWVSFASATSGSRMEARYNDMGENWELRLSVPLETGGEPYMGSYWKNFHQAVEEWVEPDEGSALERSLLLWRKLLQSQAELAARRPRRPQRQTV